MRPILYPLAEELIRNKKQEKFDEQTEEETRPGGPSAGGRRGNALTLKGLHFYLIYAINGLYNLIKMY